jgi:uncharacterized OB-fold protein
VFESFGKINFTPHTKVAEFAEYLKKGYLMGSRCSTCGYSTFPPRSDCSECMSSKFEFVRISGRGKLLTFTEISAAPTGFEDIVPYTVGVVDLVEGGRLLAWFGDSIKPEEIEIDMEVQVVPRKLEDQAGNKVYYSLDKPGTTWDKE